MKFKVSQHYMYVIKDLFIVQMQSLFVFDLIKIESNEL